jgi:hypothetical protein
MQTAFHRQYIPLFLNTVFRLFKGTVIFLFIAELAYIRIFPLTFTSYSFIFTPLYIILEFTIVTGLVIVKKTPKPPAGVFS